MLADGHVVQNGKVPNLLQRYEELSFHAETNMTYALVDPEDGLFLGINHGTEQSVFLQSSENDASTSMDAKTKATKARIDACRDGVRNTRFTWKGKKMTANVKIELSWSRSLTNDDWQLTAITRTLEAIDEDLSFASFKYQDLSWMLDPQCILTAEHAMTVVRDFLMRPPEETS